MIIGTAGHIDHGKTSLVRALTGVDTDRLKEEKARGISIQLGFAYSPVIGSDALGFIDVPGHERLVHTMVAGAGGIDFALLVVAADDGVMPQTREHLSILELLGVRRGAVALTKIDRVSNPIRGGGGTDQSLACRNSATRCAAVCPQCCRCRRSGCGGTACSPDKYRGELANALRDWFVSASRRSRVHITGPRYGSHRHRAGWTRSGGRYDYRDARWCAGSGTQHSRSESRQRIRPGRTALRVESGRDR